MSYEVTFADNTEVTLENMDNIARDLGDTEFSEFSTNKFGVNTLNSITSDLVSAGILRTEENANMGCEPIIDGTNVIIGTGVIVFDTGAKLRITEAETFVKTNSTYIYAKNDHTTGIASIVMSVTAPTSQMDTVQICRIDASGNLIDMRSSAVAKVPLTADAENVGVTKHISSGGSVMSPGYSFDVDIGFNGWEYIIYENGNSWDGTSRGCIKLPDGSSTQSFPIRNSDGYSDSRNRVTRNGSVLHFENIHDRNSSGIDVEIEVR